jgi:hypothetical protein
MYHLSLRQVNILARVLVDTPHVLPVNFAQVVVVTVAITVLKASQVDLDQVDAPIVEQGSTAVLAAYVRTVQRAHHLHQDQLAAPIA